MPIWSYAAVIAKRFHFKIVCFLMWKPMSVDLVSSSVMFRLLQLDFIFYLSFSFIQMLISTCSTWTSHSFHAEHMCNLTDCYVMSMCCMLTCWHFHLRIKKKSVISVLSSFDSDLIDTLRFSYTHDCQLSNTIVYSKYAVLIVIDCLNTEEISKFLFKKRNYSCKQRDHHQSTEHSKWYCYLNKNVIQNIRNSKRKFTRSNYNTFQKFKICMNSWILRFMPLYRYVETECVSMMSVRLRISFEFNCRLDKAFYFCKFIMKLPNLFKTVFKLPFNIICFRCCSSGFLFLWKIKIKLNDHESFCLLIENSDYYQ